MLQSFFCDNSHSVISLKIENWHNTDKAEMEIFVKPTSAYCKNFSKKDFFRIIVFNTVLVIEIFSSIIANICFWKNFSENAKWWETVLHFPKFFSKANIYNYTTEYLNDENSIENQKGNISQNWFFRKVFVSLSCNLEQVGLRKFLLRLFFKAAEEVAHSVSLLLLLDWQKGTRKAQHARTKKKQTKNDQIWTAHKLRITWRGKLCCFDFREIRIIYRSVLIVSMQYRLEYPILLKFKKSPKNRNL